MVECGICGKDFNRYESGAWDVGAFLCPKCEKRYKEELQYMRPTDTKGRVYAMIPGRSTWCDYFSYNRALEQGRISQEEYNRSIDAFVEASIKQYEENRRRKQEEAARIARNKASTGGRPKFTSLVRCPNKR